ncbi:MAG: asparagine synthase (glutamine-hydrolyzing) [Bradymonadia bacterium]|jgi:asparagine synthase (glutamine-hydrolysing)
MCGIVAWFTPTTAKPPKAVLRKMAKAIAHRGPDGHGVWNAPGVGLAHRRLSIVDVEGGAQPMQRGPFVVTYNGEIYNHGLLRRELSSRGHDFSTRSDTETLIRGLQEWGADVLPRLNGMYAFAAYNTETKEAIVARDNMGQKPLYYAHLDDGTLLVASELKALLQHPRITPTIDPTAIALYLTYEYIPYPHSAFRGIKKLPPGEVLTWRDGEISMQTHYRVPFQRRRERRPDAAWIADTRRALSTSVGRRLMSDVPLGVFLSGGIDSSAIVALMAEHRPPEEIQTFSIAFEEASFDESKWARQVAAHVGTTHREETLSADRMLALLPRVLDHMDEPFGDASLLPTTLLSMFTREHVTVALGGDGGDELYLGYETFRADVAAQLYRRAPSRLRGAIADAVNEMPVDDSNFSLDFVLKSFVKGADAVPEFRHTRWLSSFLPGSAIDPLRRELRDEVPDGVIYGAMARAYLACPDPRHQQRLSNMYLRTYMAEDILTKVDRASMSTSLEVRSPFMDPDVVSLAARTPPHLKLRGLQAKHILKRALKRDLPHDVLYRKKKGFGIPVARWLNGPLSAELDRLLAPDRIAEAGLLEPAVVSRLISEHRSGVCDHRKQLWTLMMLESWRERYDAHL